MIRRSTSSACRSSVMDVETGDIKIDVIDDDIPISTTVDDGTDISSTFHVESVWDIGNRGWRMTDQAEYEESVSYVISVLLEEDDVQGLHGSRESSCRHTRPRTTVDFRHTRKKNLPKTKIVRV